MYTDILDNIEDRERRNWVGHRVEKALDEERKRKQPINMSKQSLKASEAMVELYKEARRKGEIVDGEVRASNKTLKKVFYKVK